MLTDRAPQRLGHQPALDGVRGLAIALVISQHAWGWPGNGGIMGVEIFFVLSGFLITTLLIEELDATGSISILRFYARRALRLLPVLYATLAIVTVVVIANMAGADERYHLESILASALYIGNLYGYLGEQTDLAPALGHLWSLAVEEQFYVVAPVLTLFGLRAAARRDAGSDTLLPFMAVAALATIAVRTVLISSGKTTWTLPTSYADALLAGASLAILRRRGSALFSRRLGSVLAIVAIAVVAVSCALPSVDIEDAAGLPYLWMAAVGVLVVVAANQTWSVAGRALAHPVPVWLGGISYGLYVVHGPVLVGLASTSLDPPAVVGVAISIALAYASRRWFESAFLRLKPKARAQVEQPVT